MDRLQNKKWWDMLPLLLIDKKDIVFPYYADLLEKDNLSFENIEFYFNTKNFIYAVQTFSQTDFDHAVNNKNEKTFVLLIQDSDEHQRSGNHNNKEQNAHIYEPVLLGNVGVLCALPAGDAGILTLTDNSLIVPFVPLSRVTIGSIRSHKYRQFQKHKSLINSHIYDSSGIIACNIETLVTINDVSPTETILFMDKLRSLYFTKIISSKYREDLDLNRLPFSHLEEFIDHILNQNSYRPEIKYAILAEQSLKVRAEKTLLWLTYIEESRYLNEKIEGLTLRQMELNNQEYHLKERLKIIRKELQLDQSVAELLEMRVRNSEMSPEAKQKARKEIERLKNLNNSGPDFDISKNYVETLLSLPWGQVTPEPKTYNIISVKEQLDKSHFGIHIVKKRIIEYVALQKRRSKNTALAQRNQIGAQILCFMGPPGIGKTTIAQAIAEVLNKKFARISFGGMTDESEVRGHRRTYIGANVGTFVDKIINLGVDNPVILLDEIDKVSRDISYRGNVASALLEILDPSQNNKFRDFFLDVPYDFSKVFFIATANTADMHPALKDRLEIIEMKGYNESDKLKIATHHIIPSLKKAYLLKDYIEITSLAIKHIINHYTFESGVRSLKRQLEAIFRKVVTILEEGTEQGPIAIKIDTLPKFLGVPKIHPEEFKVSKLPTHGRVNGLAYNISGIGSVTNIEALALPGQGKVTITGNLGKVMHESVMVAMVVVKSLLPFYNLPHNTLSALDLCIHFSQAATNKDGPSAGVGICIAILSAVTHKKVLPCVGITGEIGLHGDILPVGGINEKINAAIMSKLKVVYLPLYNKYDVDELPDSITSKIQINFVKHIHEVIKDIILV